jgi:tetratricopeptide (TPR) repeat protein
MSLIKRTAAGFVLLFLLGGDGKGALPTRTILVFPFENQSARQDLGWISEGSAEIISARLAGTQRYVLGREERNEAYEQLGIPPGTPLTLASEYKVAQTLGVGWAVVGNFTVEGDRLTARAQLLNVRDLKLSPPFEGSGELADLVDLQTRLAWRLLASYDAGFTVGTEDDFSDRFADVRLDAFENYIRGILATDRQSRVRFLREADRLNPRDHQAAFELGRYYVGENDYADSEKWLRKLDHKDANYLESLFLLGVDEFFLGHEEEAQKAFSTLSQQIPLDEVWNNLGVILSRRHRYAEALTTLQRAYEGDPADADFCFNIALCYWYLKRYGDAAAYLGQALKIDDEDTASHSLLALVYAKLGDSEAQHTELRWLAEHQAKAAVNVESDGVPQPRMKKRFDGRAFKLLTLEVSNALEENLSNLPPGQHGEVHLSRGKQFLSAGRLPEAERELNEAASLLSANSEAHLVLGQLYEAQGKHTEAARELQTALKLDNNAVTHLWLAHVYLSLNQPTAALDQGQAALTLDPGNRDAEHLIDAIRNHTAPTGKAP